jgi:hypothetical protein
MQDNTPINFYIKHFFINYQIKKLQPIFDTFVPPCMSVLYCVNLEQLYLKDIIYIISIIFVLLFLFYSFPHDHRGRAIGCVFFYVVSPVGIVHDAVEVYCFTLFDLFVT